MSGSIFKKGLVVGIIFLLIGITVASSTVVELNNDIQTSPIHFGITIYVDDDNIYGPWDGTYAHPYKDIQDGVDNSSNGDIVYVLNGNYSTTSVTRTIDLNGENRENTIINGKLVIRKSNTNVSGFTVQKKVDYQSGLIIEKNVNGCKIVNNIVKSHDHHGITFVQDCDDTVLIGNIIIDNKQEGIECGYGCDDAQFYDNIIMNNRDGIYLNTCRTSILSGNTISNNNGKGIYLWECWKLEISNNNFTSNSGRGIHIDRSARTLVEKNNFIDNQAPYYKTTSGLLDWQTKFKQNYWDDWDGTGRYRIPMKWIIFGYQYYEFITIDWFKWDWNPASEPI